MLGQGRQEDARPRSLKPTTDKSQLTIDAKRIIAAGACIMLDSLALS